MVKGKDREHFQDYREQTQVKHSILAAYLPAYYNILKRWSPNLVYIDGFAGPGSYQRPNGEAFAGSPMRALELIADNNDFSKQVSTIFIESDDKLFDELKSRVDNFYREHPQIRKPLCRRGTFSDSLNEILGRIGGKLAPTFLFVDPCGVRGTSFETIRAVMQNEKCEAFIFFNIDGIRRIAGLSDVSDVLVELMGSTSRAEALHGKLKRTADTQDREKLILTEYCRAIEEEMGARFLIPFRVESEDHQKTSHYLIHATKHPLGFSIMKDVMWRRGHGEDQPGGLELIQRGRTNFIPLFDRHAQMKDEILAALRSGPTKVSVFYKDWVMRATDMQCESSYRQALLDLEKEDKIEVLSKDGKKVVSANARPRPKNKPTLAKDYYVRLRV